jgi:hypothetical protein
MQSLTSHVISVGNVPALHVRNSLGVGAGASSHAQR